MLAGVDTTDLRRAIGGIVLESAYLERVLRTAVSALIGSKYVAVIDSRLMAFTLIEHCRHIAAVHTEIGAPERAELLRSLRACESVNHERNRVIHEACALRPGNVTVTLPSQRSSREVTVAARTVSELDELADRICGAADDLSAAILAALGPASLRIEDQLRAELGHDLGPDQGS
jgi:hypothetical protein